MKLWKWEITISRAEKGPTKTGNQPSNVKLTPGNLTAWMLQESAVLEKQAGRRQLYQTRIEEFEKALDIYRQRIISENKESPDIIADAENAMLQWKSRLEWIERAKESRKNWEKSALEYTKKTDEFVTRVNENAYKYMLIAYGAAFLFAFNTFIDPALTDTNTQPLIDALWVLIAGFLFTVGHIWLTIEVQGQDRDYVKNQISAWDYDEVKIPWLLKYKMRWWTRPLALLSILSLPLAAAVFVYKIDLWQWITSFF